MSLLEGLSLLEAGDWNAAHEIAQEDESPHGSWLHGIVHMVEGDAANAEYWYRRAGRPFPGTAAIAAEMAALRETLLPPGA